MPTVIDGLSRRDCLAWGAGLVAPAAWAAAAPAAPFAAWDDDTRRAESAHAIGALSVASGSVSVRASLSVPTRAHGLLAEREGTLLAVARRPGDWLLRWHPARRSAHWCWSDPGRVFNGHAERHGPLLYSTQTDLETGAGQVVVHDAASLRTRAVWPTHGRDPHDLLFDRDGALWVANGGIGTDAATGRSKDTRTMDSSLVRLDAASGALLGRWQLADSKLSLRHLALADDGSIGVALQAEHDDAAQREAAPLLALWRDGELNLVPGPPAAGYGGDIAVLGARWFVSAPRAGRVLAWQPDGGWSTFATLPEPCALAAAAQRLWCGAAGQALQWNGALAQPLHGLRFDNHATWA